MKLLFSPRFRKQYRGAPLHVQKAFDKQATLLVQNLRHPSLNAKKYDEARDVWQARVTRDWRPYYEAESRRLHWRLGASKAFRGPVIELTLSV